MALISKTGLAESGVGDSHPRIEGTQQEGFQPGSNLQQSEKIIKKKDAALGSCILCFSAWVLWISLLSHFPLGARSNPEEFLWDPGLLGKGRLWKRGLSAHLFYVFKRFVVLGLGFLDFEQTAIPFVIFCHSHFLGKGGKKKAGSDGPKGGPATW